MFSGGGRRSCGPQAVLRPSANVDDAPFPPGGLSRRPDGPAADVVVDDRRRAPGANTNLQTLALVMVVVSVLGLVIVLADRQVMTQAHLRDMAPQDQPRRGPAVEKECVSPHGGRVR